jgi:hypothetical protein
MMLLVSIKTMRDPVQIDIEALGNMTPAINKR